MMKSLLLLYLSILNIVFHINSKPAHVAIFDKKNGSNIIIAKGSGKGKPEQIITQMIIPTQDPSTWHGANMPLFIGTKTNRTLSLSDFKYAADAGANVIRLSVFADPAAPTYVPFFSPDGKLLPQNDNPALNALTKAVSMAAEVNIKIIIDMHTMPGNKDGKIWQNEIYWEQLTQIWTLVARKFKNDNTVLAFDLMNEPGIIGYIRSQNVITKMSDEAQMYLGRWSPPENWINTPRDYGKEMANLIRSIREIDNGRSVIVEGFGILGNPVNFNWMKPIVGFKNVIYSCHMYVPTGLTMLGTKGSIKKGNESDVKPFNLATDEAAIDKAFAPVVAFQKKYNVPIFIGEFGITTEGIFGKNAEGKSYNGACWLSTVIRKMNENKWGWTYWELWPGIRNPQSTEDPRYKILSNAMKGQTIPNYCN